MTELKLLSGILPVILIFFVTSISGCGSSAPSSVQGNTESQQENGAVTATTGDIATTGEAAESVDIIKPADATPTYSDEAFLVAAHDGNIDLVRRALRSGTELEASDPGKGYTALLMAAYNGHSHVVRFLIEQKAQIDVRDFQGKTPLMHACSGPFAESAKLLIDAGADVNATESTEGFTPLMTAAALGQKEVVELLIQRGANLATIDDDGDSALDHAKATNQEEIVALLKK